jgi:hypothetical protein
VTSKTSLSKAAFTLIEMLVAGGLAAACFSAVALLYQSITVNQKRMASIIELNIGSGKVTNYFDLSGSTIRVNQSPNYGRVAFAEELREIFWDDVESAAAVFCLSRDDINTVRPTSIPFPAANPPRIDTPNGFRTLLAANFAGAAGLFQTYRGKPTGKNASIFIIGHSDDPNNMPVRCVYDIDFDTPSGRTGTYASVRRYQYGTLTNFYDCYFEQGTGSAFAPVFVHFERQARRTTVEADAIQRLKQGPGQPFYMIWWPDPGMPNLERSAPVPTYSATDPRIDYAHMGGRTALSFVVPVYPSL